MNTNMTITWESLNPTQQAIMESGKDGHAFTIGSWEEDKLRQAGQLAQAGLLTYGGVDRFNGRSHFYSVTITGQTLMQQRRQPPQPAANMGLSAFSLEQQLRINAALVAHLYERTRQLMIQLETAQGKRGDYGTTVMTDKDRLINRIMASLIVNDLGMPPHDVEALEWLEKTLSALAV